MEITKGYTQGKITVIGKAKVSGFTVRCECGTYSVRESSELRGNDNDSCEECQKNKTLE